jgi:glycosyltransferase involved in cell wall biosynthesis
MFSIILPTFNRVHRLEEVIKSIQNQTYSNWELLIIDDASTDGTENFIQPFLSDSRIRYFKNETNQERCNSRNRGILEAQGDYICFLDSDDYHLPNHLQTFYEELKKRNFPKAFFFTNAYNQSENEIESEGTGLTERVCPDYETVDPYTYFLRYTVNPQRWCVHKEVMLEHLFDPEVIICEDMDTSLRMVAAGIPVFQIKERTTVYVAASDSFTHGDPKKWEKELFYLKRIFSKPVLSKYLPNKEKRRLLSMCYFHISNTAYIAKSYRKQLLCTIKSYFLFPRGYNGKTNKIMFVSLVYGFPFLGNLIRRIKDGL